MLATKRTRHVYPPEQVAHLWAHKSQDSARNSGDTFYFRGASIYSYGSHFEIARHVRNEQGAAAILMTTRTYSNSTSRHTTIVRSACRHIEPQFYVPLNDWPGMGESSISENEGYFIAFQQAYIRAMERSKKARRYRDTYLQSARNTVEEANRFAEFFGLPHRLSLPTNYAAMCAEAFSMSEKLAKREQARLRAREEKREKERIEREKEEREALGEWLKGTYSSRFHRFHSLPFAYFRLRPSDHSMIETSLGAEFPADHGKRTYRILKKLREENKTYHRNGHSIHVGAFVVDSLNEEGIVKAGCHNVEWVEIERFATIAGWNGGAE